MLAPPAASGLATLLAEALAVGAAWTCWRRSRSMRGLRLRRPVSLGEVASCAREGAPLGALDAAETGDMAGAITGGRRAGWRGAAAPV